MSLSSHPAKTAAWLTLILSVVYLVAALVLVPTFSATPQRIAMNASLADNIAPPSLSPSYLLWGVWQRFDTLWYRRVAEQGYDMPASTVFYPAYPAAIRVLACVGIPTDLGAVLAARIATFFLLWGLIQLLKLDLGDTEVKRALALLLVWPMSFVLFGGYAEPLLMCFTIWSIWFARNDRWWLAALFGLLACLSRAVGMVVVAPLVWIAWRQRPLRYAPLLLALSGPVLFPVWLRWSGLGLSAAAYPKYWHTTMAWPWTTLADAFSFSGGEIAWFVGMNAAAMLLAFGVSLVRPIRWEYFWYALGTLCFILTANSRPPLHSYVRYALPVFPAFASAGRLLRLPALMTLVWGVLVLANALLLYAFWDWFFLV
ncbi:hypothetical protein [Paludibaculum fermentans]|uniref:Integral membrane protein n=1 Tax=Paludibaculum fermentans TaxID=1473598 RepID=A0A7S7NP06_PALFE|nr:hypothetical protein [Paludibaculum fermentans]QOY87148.1 hypothetical protein IRI77_30945 [Paludibaculum fermentans]